ncbi:MAG TPA: hypothetical protein ENJ93_01600 [Chloroflexi bacterium]|nr:hypothetical protein [Chloroflexota bacterium]
MSKLVDENGVVHERGWDGQYRPKQGLLGPARETDWRGQPNVEKDWLGNPKGERDEWGRPVQSTSGKNLYRSAGSDNDNTGSSNGGGEILIGLLVLFLLFFVVLIFIGVILVLGIPVLITVWKKLSSSAGRKELGVFLAGIFTLIGLVFLSFLAWESLAGGYNGWETVLYPILALSGWGGAIWITIRQRWYKDIHRATNSLLEEYGRGVELMLEQVGSFFDQPEPN